MTDADTCHMVRFDKCCKISKNSRIRFCYRPLVLSQLSTCAPCPHLSCSTFHCPTFPRCTHPCLTFLYHPSLYRQYWDCGDIRYGDIRHWKYGSIQYWEYEDIQYRDYRCQCSAYYYISGFTATPKTNQIEKMLTSMSAWIHLRQRGHYIQKIWSCDGSGKSSRRRLYSFLGVTRSALGASWELE